MRPWLVSLGQDVRYVLRTIRRQPVFSASVVLILTFGIGLVTALFTVFNARVLRPWPVPDPSSLVLITPRPAVGDPNGTLSNLEYRYFREHSRTFLQLASTIGGGGPIGSPDGTTFATVQTQFVTANYFDALRIRMAIGRGFLADEEDYQSPRAVAVISERVWREYFGSDPGVIGSQIRVRNELMTVIGVTERGFVGVRGSIRVDLWMPLPTAGIAVDRQYSADWRKSFDDPRRTSGMVFGRLRPGVTADEARAEIDVLSRQFRSSLAMEAPGVLVDDRRPIVRGALRHVLAGLAAGVVLSLIATPVLRRALYGMSPFDPIAYLEIAAILLASSLAATWIPAVRATRVEPAVTLRGD